MEIKFKVDNEFYQQLYIDLPIVKVTVNCVCFEHNGNLTTVNFYRDRHILIPNNTDLLKLTTVRVSISTKNIIKIY